MSEIPEVELIIVEVLTNDARFNPPHACYIHVPTDTIAFTTPYVIDTVEFIKEKYFAMADNFDVENVAHEFFEEMCKRERKLSNAAAKDE